MAIQYLVAIRPCLKPILLEIIKTQNLVMQRVSAEEMAVQAGVAAMEVEVEVQEIL